MLDQAVKSCQETERHTKEISEVEELSHGPTVGVFEFQICGQLDQNEQSTLVFDQDLPSSPSKINVNEELPEVPLISFGEVVLSLSQFDQSMMNPSSECQ